MTRNQTILRNILVVPCVIVRAITLMPLHCIISVLIIIENNIDDYMPSFKRLPVSDAKRTATRAAMVANIYRDGK
jgi:hypothetical protein